MKIEKGQFTGLTTHPRYFGYKGHYKLHEGDICWHEDKQEGYSIISWDNNKGAWVLKYIGSCKSKLLFTMVNIIEPIGNKHKSNEILKLLNNKRFDEIKELAHKYKFNLK